MAKTGKPLRAALYARVSTDKQSTANQLLELRQAAERRRRQGELAPKVAKASSRATPAKKRARR